MNPFWCMWMNIKYDVRNNVGETRRVREGGEVHCEFTGTQTYVRVFAEDAGYDPSHINRVWGKSIFLFN
jgi:hypothetical protein